MKNVLLFLIVGAMAQSGCWAQDRIVLLRDTTRLGISLDDLEKKYPPALNQVTVKSGVSVRESGALGTKPKLFADSLSAVYQRFYQFIDANRRRLPVLGVMVRTNEFIQPDGTYDRVLCEFSGAKLTDEQEGKLLQVVAEWYSQNRFPIKTKTGFRWQNFMQIGFAPQKRIARHGPGIISTLEAAEKTTRPDTVTKLLFNQLELIAIPEIVYRFPKLEELDLSKNKLHELPARLTADIPTLKRLSVLFNAIPNDSVFITRNKHLQVLNLQGNKLTHIPWSVRQNRRLESLWMGNNKLTSLDVKTLRRLHRLTELNLYNAGLTQLPKTIGRLRHLKVLDLYYNKFTELPRQMGRLKRLEQLAVAHNDLRDFPVSLAKLRRLQVLFAHHNQIGRLPVEFQKLHNLRILDLGYNWFTVVPDVLSMLPSLEELDLNNNNLQELSPSLVASKHLRKLYLRSNPISRDDAKSGPYAPIIQQLEANRTEVFY